MIEEGGDMYDQLAQASANETRRGQAGIEMVSYGLDHAAEVTGWVARSGINEATMDEYYRAVAPPNTNIDTFKNKLRAAVKYGLLTSRIDKEHGGQSVVSVAPLGYDILDPEKSAEARKKAFGNIELHAELLRLLPNALVADDDELNRAMKSLGVTDGQLDNARQTFRRVARQAGLLKRVAPMSLFAVSDDLAPDGGGGLMQRGGLHEVVSERPNDEYEAVRLAPGLHKYIGALLEEIPARGSGWPAGRRERWQRMFDSMLDYIFDTDAPPEP